MMGTDVLDSIITDRSSIQPNNIDMIYYLFWEKGIDYTGFCNLPIPYILRILKAHHWVKKEEEKAHNKATKR